MVLLNTAKFTFVIGYRHQPDRLVNLRRTLDWLSGFSGIEIVIVEQDKHSKIKHLSLKCRHIFVENSGPYNRAWAFNVALKRTSTPIIVFGDSDLIMDPAQFIESLKETENYDVVSPYRSVVDLTPQESMMDLGSIFRINRAGRGETDNQKINLTGGVVIFKREAADIIGGWGIAEKNFGWGGEDDIETIVVNHFLKSKEMPYKSYHLYHQKQQIIPELYQRNLQNLNEVAKMTKEQLRGLMMNEWYRCGSLNKYSN
jgi:hypothetical protein